MEDFSLKKVKERKFSLLVNFYNSINGLVEVTKNEKPMQFEVILLVIGVVFIALIDMDFIHKAILFISLLFPIFSELVNSSIERVVDLVTEDYQELAKHAKDAGSAVVLVGTGITGFIWIATLYHYYVGT